MMKKLLILILAVTSCFENPNTIEKNDEAGFMVEWKIETDNVDAPYTPPLVIENSKVVYSGEISLKLVDAFTGKELWAGEIDNQRTLISNSLLYDDELDRIVSSHMEDFKGWSSKTGELLFTLNQDHGIAAFSIGKNTILDNGYGVVSENSDVYIIEKDGTIRFELDIPYGTSGVAYSKDKIYLAQGKTIHGLLSRGKIRAFNSQNGDSLWTYNTEHGGFISSPALIEDKILYAGTRGNSPNSLVVALDIETGKAVWEYITSEAKEFSASLTVGPNLVYSGASGALVALNKVTGEKVWRFDWESSTIVKPVYLKGFIYHSDHNRLFVLDAETGKLVHEEPVPDGGSYFWHLSVSEDKLFAQTSTQLIAYQPWHLRED